MHVRKQTNISQDFSFKNMTLVKVPNYQSTVVQPNNQNKSNEGYKYDTPAYIYKTEIVQQETELWTCWRTMNV